MSRKVVQNGSTVVDTDSTLVYNLVFKSTLKARNVSVLSSATLLPDVPLARRMSVIIQNYGNEVLFIGSSDVTINDGFPILPRATLQLSIEEEVNVYGIVAAGPCNVRILEGA